jgi:hypothetical protein
MPEINMSANPTEQLIRAPFELSESQPYSKARSTSDGLAVSTLLAVLTLYWCYVALSNVLYASSMQATLEQQHVFASWPARVLQHLFLYPFLVGCVWTSLRVGWQPAWRALPMQLLLCLGFAILARPALGMGEWLNGQPPSMQHPMAGEPQVHSHGMLSAITDGGLANWIASALGFVLT